MQENFEHVDGETTSHEGPSRIKDGTICIWEIASGKLAARLRPDSDSQLINAAFDPKGRLLATAGTDGQIRIWDILSQQEYGNFAGGFPAAMESGQWESHSLFSFSGDGSTLASTGGHSGVLVWDLQPVWERLSETQRSGKASDAGTIWSPLASDNADEGLAAVRDAVLADEAAWTQMLRLAAASYRLSGDQRAHVDSLLKELGAESFSAREKAAKELGGLEPRYLLELNRRKDSITDLEVREQIASVLPAVTTYAGPEGRRIDRLQLIHAFTTPDRREMLVTILP